MVIYKKENYIQVSHQAEKNYMLFDWTDFFVTILEVKELHQKALDFAVAHQCFYFVAETSKVTTAFSQSIIRWWGEEWVPVLSEAGVKAIITVVPTDLVATLSTHSWQSQVTNGITMQNAKNLAEAEALIENLRNNQ